MKQETPRDVLILGGGITGISFGRLLAETGKSCLLVERGDFASGTSQASGMMIWGGLLYLKSFEFRQVARLCRARDRLMETLPEEVVPRRFAYLRSRENGRNPWMVRAALAVYQLMSGGRREAVLPFPAGDVLPGLDAGRFLRGWSYEEGFLKESDARFSLRRLFSSGPSLEARNHCEMILLRREDGLYHATLRDRTGNETTVSARRVVNCCGVWADETNARHGIVTRHTHHLSKGVYLLLPRVENDRALVVDMGRHGDTLCWGTLGETVMWGPTETTIPDIGHVRATAEDVSFLLERLNYYSRRKWTREEIVNVRCGVRPLACLRGRKVEHPMSLSRKAVVEKAAGEEWWTVFGGKLSGAADLAERLFREMFGHAPEKRSVSRPSVPAPVTREFFQGRELPDPLFCRDHEQCATLEDYLRRRTNLAQWIPRAGFGRNGEFEQDLLAIARIFHENAQAAVADWRSREREERALWYE